MQIAELKLCFLKEIVTGHMIQDRTKVGGHVIFFLSCSLSRIHLFSKDLNSIWVLFFVDLSANSVLHDKLPAQPMISCFWHQKKFGYGEQDSDEARPVGLGLFCVVKCLHL